MKLTQIQNYAGHSMVLFRRRTPNGLSGAALFAGTLAFALTGCDGKLQLDADDQETINEGKEAANGSPGDPTLDPADETSSADFELTRPHLRRLTATQFENTVRNALGDSAVSPETLPDFGDDIPTIGLNNNPSILRVTNVNVDSLYSSTQALAQSAVEQTPVVRDCVAASDDACFAEVVDELGLKLWRRPLTEDERSDLLTTRAELASAPATRAEQAEFLVHVLLASPNTLYRRELGVDRDGRRQFDDYEIASALSYTIWNGPPDAELLALAESGELREEDTLRAQAQRLAADNERVAAAMAEFFLDYLKIDALFTKTKIDELGLTPDARASLVEGIRRDLTQTFAAPDASLLDPFRTDAFHVDAESATFFGVPMVSSGGYEIVAMAPGERLGVLSHPAFLSVHAGEGDSGIVKRGVFALEQLLCIHLGAPPPDITESEDVPEDFDDQTATSREVLTVRHSSQAECVNCHQIIDPAGFGFEHYDSAGRYRDFEKGDVPIDASGELNANGEVLSYETSVEYIDALVGSEALRSCITNTYFTYVLGDEPRPAEREALYTTFNESDGRISSLVEALATTPSFTARENEEQP